MRGACGRHGEQRGGERTYGGDGGVGQDTQLILRLGLGCGQKSRMLKDGEGGVGIGSAGMDVVEWMFVDVLQPNGCCEWRSSYVKEKGHLYT